MGGSRENDQTAFSQKGRKRAANSVPERCDGGAEGETKGHIIGLQEGEATSGASTAAPRLQRFSSDRSLVWVGVLPPDSDHAMRRRVLYLLCSVQAGSDRWVDGLNPGW